MEEVYYEEEEPINSVGHKQQKKVDEFKEYLVRSNTIEHFIKCMHSFMQFCLEFGQKWTRIKEFLVVTLCKCSRIILELLPRTPLNKKCLKMK